MKTRNYNSETAKLPWWKHETSMAKTRNYDGEHEKLQSRKREKKRWRKHETSMTKHGITMVNTRNFNRENAKKKNDNKKHETSMAKHGITMANTRNFNRKNAKKKNKRWRKRETTMDWKHETSMAKMRNNDCEHIVIPSFQVSRVRLFFIVIISSSLFRWTIMQWLPQQDTIMQYNKWLFSFLGTESSTLSAIYLYTYRNFCPLWLVFHDYFLDYTSYFSKANQKQHLW